MKVIAINLSTSGETSGGASLMDKLVYRMANMARWANNTNMFTYSTKIMASTDDAFG